MSARSPAPSARGLPRSTGIPTYASNGRRLRNYSLSTIETCLRMTPPGAIVKRNKRTGRITSAQFIPLPRDSSAIDGKEAIRPHAHMGQRYSFLAPVGEDGHRAWRFAAILTPRDMRDDCDVEAADLEAWLQKIFRAVQLSCLTKSA